MNGISVKSSFDNTLTKLNECFPSSDKSAYNTKMVILAFKNYIPGNAKKRKKFVKITCNNCTKHNTNTINKGKTPSNNIVICNENTINFLNSNMTSPADNSNSNINMNMNNHIIEIDKEHDDKCCECSDKYKHCHCMNYQNEMMNNLSKLDNNIEILLKALKNYNSYDNKDNKNNKHQQSSHDK